jgi:hypothetical protein
VGLVVMIRCLSEVVSWSPKTAARHRHEHGLNLKKMGLIQFFAVTAAGHQSVPGKFGAKSFTWTDSAARMLRFFRLKTKQRLKLTLSSL